MRVHFRRALLVLVAALLLPAGVVSATTPEQVLGVANAELYKLVADQVSLESFASLTQAQRNLIITMSEDEIIPSHNDVMFCFWGDVPDDVLGVIEKFYAKSAEKFEPATRWTSTATNGGGLVDGQPITLTYSFIPDGTTIPNIGGIENGDQASNLFAFLDGIYGSTAAWQAVFADVFARWSEVTGITYVYEPNDDGGTFPGDDNGLPGVIGVRGDVRIGADDIDGSGASVLAVNYFPNAGDMVLDSTNGDFYGDLSGDSLMLRNVAAHEHGHGLGMPHTCPVNQTKLMEPFVTDAFDGPQLDDILSGQNLYGDVNAGNSAAATAADLGSLSEETASVSEMSLHTNSASDFFKFTVASSQVMTIDLTPTGTTYLSGPQVGLCDTGSNYNSLSVMDLSFQLIDTDMATVLATANSNGAGLSESTGFNTGIGDAGTYYIRVFTGSGSTDVQAYALDVTVATTAGPQFSNPSGGGWVELAAVTAELSFNVFNTVDPTSFEWFKDGSVTPLANGGTISGADTDTLSISPVDLTDSGSYVLRVTDASKSVSNSPPIVLVVVEELPVAGIIGVGLLAVSCVAGGAWAVRKRRA